MHETARQRSARLTDRPFLRTSYRLWSVACQLLMVAPAIALRGVTAATGQPPMHWRRNMTGQALRFTKLTLALCVGALGACSKADRAADTAAARTDSAAGRVDS